MVKNSAVSKPSMIHIFSKATKMIISFVLWVTKLPLIHGLHLHSEMLDFSL